MSRPGRIGLAALALMAAVVVVALVVFVRQPLQTFAWLGRASLRGAGLARKARAVPGGEVVWFEGGQGPAVIFLHGVNDQAGAWARVVKPVAARHRVLVPDLPGHGASAPRQGPLAIEDLVAGVEPLIREAAPVTLVGNSLGGYLALLLAQRHPEQVAHVVLVNGAATHGGGGTVELMPRTRAEAARTIAALSGPRAPLPPGFVLDDIVRRTPGSPLARLISGAPGPVLDGRLGEIAAPTTLIFGDADRLLTPAYARAVAGALPRARLEFIAGCGHIPQRECPGALVPLLLRAIDSPPPGPLPTQ